MAFTYASVTTPTTGTGTFEFDGTTAAAMQNGLSGLQPSRLNNGVGWIIVDHDNLTTGGWQLFAIQLISGAGISGSKGQLLRRVIFDGTVAWSDVEGMTAHLEGSTWFLDIWDNGNDDVYVWQEPVVTLGQALVSTSGVAPSKIIRPTGPAASGNCEAIAWHEPDDTMCWISPRGVAGDDNDNRKIWITIPAWSTLAHASTPASTSVPGPVGRPVGTSPAANAVGDMDISRDGNLVILFGVAGVSGPPDTRNRRIMPWGKRQDQSWPDRFDEKPQLTTAETLGLAPSVMEHGALYTDMTKTYYGGEGDAGTTGGNTYSKVLVYSPSVDDTPPDPAEGGSDSDGLSGTGRFTTRASAVRGGDVQRFGSMNQIAERTPVSFDLDQGDWDSYPTPGQDLFEQLDEDPVDVADAIRAEAE